MSKCIGATSALFVVVGTPRRKICTDNHKCHAVGKVTSPRELVLARLSILGDKLNSGKYVACHLLGNASTTEVL